MQEDGEYLTAVSALCQTVAYSPTFRSPLYSRHFSSESTHSVFNPHNQKRTTQSYCFQCLRLSFAAIQVKIVTDNSDLNKRQPLLPALTEAENQCLGRRLSHLTSQLAKKVKNLNLAFSLGSLCLFLHAWCLSCVIRGLPALSCIAALLPTIASSRDAQKPEELVSCFCVSSEKPG